MAEQPLGSDRTVNALLLLPFVAILLMIFFPQTRSIAGLSNVQVVITVTVLPWIFNTVNSMLATRDDDDLQTNEHLRVRKDLIDWLYGLDRQLREWSDKEETYWEKASKLEREQFDSEVEERCSELCELLNNLEATNDRLRQALTDAIRDDPEIVERSLPEWTTDSDAEPTEVVHRWKGHTAHRKMTDYRWILECGYALLNSTTEAKLEDNLRRQTSREDIRFEVGDWDRRTREGDDWVKTLWMARDMAEQSVWDVVEQNKELFDQQQQLIHEIVCLRDEVLDLLGEDVSPVATTPLRQNEPTDDSTERNSSERVLETAE